jgi:hypothetical protein
MRFYSYSSSASEFIVMIKPSILALYQWDAGYKNIWVLLSKVALESAVEVAT